MSWFCPLKSYEAICGAEISVGCEMEVCEYDDILDITKHCILDDLIPSYFTVWQGILLAINLVFLLLLLK